MLGLKIMLTGLVAMAVFGGIVAAIGSPMPRPLIAAPILLGFCAGVVAVLIGLLMVIWGLGG